jgi:hypothetical protein
MARSQKSHFLNNFGTKKIVSCRIQDRGFLDPLISQGQNSESKEAHQTTSELTVFPSFSARFHRERAWPFRVIWWV